MTLYIQRFVVSFVSLLFESCVKEWTYGIVNKCFACLWDNKLTDLLKVAFLCSSGESDCNPTNYTGNCGSDVR